MASPIASRSGPSAGMENATWSCPRAALIAARIALAFLVPTWLLIAVRGPRRASAELGAIAGRIREIASEMAGEPADAFFAALTCTLAGPTIPDAPGLSAPHPTLPARPITAMVRVVRSPAIRTSLSSLTMSVRRRWSAPRTVRLRALNVAGSRYSAAERAVTPALSAPVRVKELRFRVLMSRKRVVGLQVNPSAALPADSCSPPGTPEGRSRPRRRRAPARPQ